MSADFGRIVVDEAVCQGCGSCAAVCPNSASVLRGFTDSQVLTMIDAALESAHATPNFGGERHVQPEETTT